MLRLLSIAFRDGGWAMWVIFASGLAGTGVGALFAWRGERLLLASVRWLIVALVASGCFGFFVDLQAVMRFSTVGLDEIHAARGGVPADRRTYVVLEGLNECLNCLSSTFFFVLMIAVLVAIGCWRSTRDKLLPAPSK